MTPEPEPSTSAGASTFKNDYESVSSDNSQHRLRSSRPTTKDGKFVFHPSGNLIRNSRTELFVNVSRQNETYKDGCRSNDVISGIHSAENSQTFDLDYNNEVRLFPVSNIYAAVTAGTVVLYSAAFLFYAQRHTVILLIMTGLIGVFVILLYALSIISFIYLILRIDALECAEDSGSKTQNIAYITVNNSYPSSTSSTTLQSDYSNKLPRKSSTETNLSNQYSASETNSNVIEVKF